MKKKLLIVTDSFPPAFAPRIGYLCKYLSKSRDWYTVVVHLPDSDGSHSSSYRHLEGFADEVYEIDGTDGRRLLFRAGFCNLMKCRMNFRDFLLMFLSKVSFGLFAEPINSKGRAFIKRLVKERDFNYVLCSVGGFGNNVLSLADCAARVAGVRFLLDIRDLYEQYARKDFFYKKWGFWQLSRRNRIIKHCRRVITVCQEGAAYLHQIHSSVSVVPNGFDPDVFKAQNNRPCETFDIVYIGSSNTKNYPVAKFCEVLKLFVTRNSPSNVKVIFYSTPETFKSGIQEFVDNTLKPYFVNEACVQQIELVNRLANASVLLLFGHNTVGVPVGVSTKLYEYMAMNRPILEVNDGDTQTCEYILEKAHAGCVANTVEEAVSFLQSQYQDWKACGFTSGHTDMEYVKNFSRETQCKEIEKLILEKV